MINEVKLKNFKSHISLGVNIKSLTLLVGTNSSGKSSIIQAILLAVHNVTNTEASPLNGHLVSLGSFDEVASFISNSSNVEIEIIENIENFVKLSIEKFEENWGASAAITSRGHMSEKLNYNKRHIHYLSANRIGAQDIYLKNYDRYDVFGINGEYVIDYFELHKSIPIDQGLINDKSSFTLGTQVNYWLNRIASHELDVEDISGTNYLKARFKLKTDDPLVSKYVKPINTGSGVSYLLSILIVCLASKKGDIVIIENPEIHLHPKAQAALVEFFVFVSNYGIQLIIESHSDHIFNGLRVQINDNKITPEDISVNFFTKNVETLASEHTVIEIDENGRVLNHQDLLFDQFDNDINSLLGI